MDTEFSIFVSVEQSNQQLEDIVSNRELDSLRATKRHGDKSVHLPITSTPSHPIRCLVEDCPSIAGRVDNRFHLREFPGRERKDSPSDDRMFTDMFQCGIDDGVD